MATVVARLRAAIAGERNPPLVALHEAARARDVTFLAGEELVSVGLGGGALVWPAGALPDPAAIDWSRVHDVPVALVTGSNGKTTVVRLLAAILAGQGLTVGHTSTDGVSVAGVRLAEGDYSGPSGARLLLRRPEVEAAVLETARGGLLRRGLGVDRASVAVVTNVADDHLGEFGVDSLDQLADVKLLPARAVRPGGAVVLNADDPLLRERAGSVGVPVVWFALAPRRPDWRGTWPRVAGRRCATVTGSSWPTGRRGRRWRGSTRCRSRWAGRRATTWRTRSRRRPRRGSWEFRRTSSGASSAASAARPATTRAGPTWSSWAVYSSSSIMPTIRMGWPRWGSSWPRCRPGAGSCSSARRATARTERSGRSRAPHSASGPTGWC